MSERCLICNPQARRALSPEVCQMLEDLVAEYPPDIVLHRLTAKGMFPPRPWPVEFAGRLICWNCGGSGFINGPASGEQVAAQ